MATIDEIEEKLTPIMELLQDIKARLDSGTTSTAKKAPATPPTGDCCVYIKRGNVPCTNRKRAGEDYCPDHPQGMTRDKLKKLQSEGGGVPVKEEAITTKDYEDNDDYKLITSPAQIKGVLITDSEPHRAMFKVNSKGGFDPLDEAMITQLKKHKIGMFATEKMATETAEALGGTITFKKAPIKTVKKIEKKVESSSDEEDDKPVKPLTKLSTKVDLLKKKMAEAEEVKEEKVKEKEKSKEEEAKEEEEEEVKEEEANEVLSKKEVEKVVEKAPKKTEKINAKAPKEKAKVNKRVVVSSESEEEE